LSSERHIDDLVLWYVSDSLTAEERRAIDTHLAGCAACRLMASEARMSLLAAATESEPVAPSPAMKSRLFARIDAELATARAPSLAASASQVGERTPPGELTQPLRPAAPSAGLMDSIAARWRSWSPALSLASLAVAIALLIWNATLQGQLTQSQAELSILNNPSARVANLPAAGQAPAGAGARFIAAPTDNRALLVVYGLKKLDPDKTYEFWLIRGSQAMPEGTFEVDNNGTGRLLVLSGEPVGNFEQAGITIERAGGAATPDMNALVFAGPVK
jgi:anti-sigma-K factor RskA